MKAVINPLLEQTSFDSAAPSGAATVAHKFERQGEYDLRFLEGQATLARARLTVSPDSTDRNAAPDQVSVDLKQLEYRKKMGGAEGLRAPFVVRPGGWVSFTLSGKGKPYAVVAQPNHSSYDDKDKDDKNEDAFDSRRLAPGDIFALTMVSTGQDHHS